MRANHHGGTMGASENHDADLRWFFGRGQSAFERSNFGNQIDRLLTYTQDHTGKRIPHPKEREADVLKWHRRWSCTPNRMESVLIDGERVDLSGEPWLVALREQDPDPSLTAQHTNTPVQAQPHIPDDDTMLRYAKVSGALSRLTMDQYEVLNIWYGDRGAYWAMKGSRVYGLMPRTRAGKKLLAQHADKLGEHRPDEILAAQASEQNTSIGTDTGRGLELKRADNQARALYENALRAYMEAIR